MSVSCKGCGYAFWYGDWYCDYYGSTGLHRPCPAGKGCTVRHQGGLYRQVSPPVTPKAAREDQERKRAAKRRPPVSLDENAARRLYDKGLTDVAIGQELGVTSTCILKWRRRSGLPPNARKGRPRRVEA